MNIHNNARLTAWGRAELVRRVVLDGESVRVVAAPALADRDAARAHRADPPAPGDAPHGAGDCGATPPARLDGRAHPHAGGPPRARQPLEGRPPSGARPGPPARRGRRRDAPRVRGAAADAGRGGVRALPRRGAALVCTVGHTGPRRDDRQRDGLHQPRCAGDARRARDPAPAHQALPPADERQGGALHPDRVPPLGLQEALPQLPPPQRGAAGLPRLLQRRTPAPVARPRPPAAPLPHAA